jgi:hypothetical protein
MHKYKPESSSKKIKNQMEKHLDKVPKNVTLVESKFDVIKLYEFDNWFDKFVFNLLMFITFLRDPFHNDFDLNRYRKLTPEEIEMGPIEFVKYYNVYEYNYRPRICNGRLFIIKVMFRIDVYDSFIPGLTYYVRRKLK